MSVSTRPNAFTPASTMAFAPSSVDASAITAMASPPFDVTSAGASRMSASERAAQITFAPSRAKTLVMARPMPLLAPVMMATRSVSRLTVVLQSGPKRAALRMSGGPFRPADHALFTQTRELVFADSEARLQHLVGVFAEEGRRHAHRTWRVRHPHRRPDHLRPSGNRMFAFHQRAARGDLRMRNDRVQGVDGAHRDPRRLQNRF